MKTRASNQVQKAIREGRLLKPTNYQCADCGKPATQYDHRDYRKPLDVAPVCRSCNIRRGPGLPKIDDLDQLGTKRPRSFDGFKLIHGTNVEGGEGFDPTSAVCHVNLDAVLAAEAGRYEQQFNLSAESKRANQDRLKQASIRYTGKDGKSKFSMPTGISRANWFKQRDRWCPN